MNISRNRANENVGSHAVIVRPVIALCEQLLCGGFHAAMLGEKAPRAKEVSPEHDSAIAPRFIVDQQDHLENSEEFSSRVATLITNPPGLRQGFTHPRER